MIGKDVSGAWAAGAVALALLGLGGCGNGGSAVETRDRAGEGADAVLVPTAGPPAQAAAANREEAKPVLTAAVRNSASSAAPITTSGVESGRKTKKSTADRPRNP